MASGADDEEEPPPRELYTIPASSGWFRWDEIHETERRALPEFFEAISITRNPRVYREYRDFIINKYREDPCRRLTFTDARKALIGDACLLRKLFVFLEKWGLINFGMPEPVAAPASAAGARVVVEEGAPGGVQVVPPLPPSFGERKSPGPAAPGSESGFRLPPLTSYSDVFGEWAPCKAPVCSYCGEQAAFQCSESRKDGFIVCSKCSKTKNNKGCTTENSSDPKDSGDNHASSAWTDAETLLLLEGVLKHGDDWDLIAQHVRTRSKSDCIARLIQLPFGDHMLGNVIKYDSRITASQIDDAKASQHAVSDPSKLPTQTIGGCTENDGNRNAIHTSIEERPLKRERFLPSTDFADSLMKQVALLSSVAGPHVAATAANAAITVLCNESGHAREAFDVSNGETADKIISSNCEMKGDFTAGEQESMDGETDTPLLKPKQKFSVAAYRIRAAIATALGVAAARTKLLADQEEREIELLMSSIIEAQLRKIQYKIKHFGELEFMMEQEHTLIQQLKESTIDEWLTVLQQAFQAGIPRSRDDAFQKPSLNKNTP